MVFLAVEQSVIVHYAVAVDDDFDASDMDEVRQLATDVLECRVEFASGAVSWPTEPGFVAVEGDTAAGQRVSGQLTLKLGETK